MSFGLFLLGAVIVIGGVAWALIVAGVAKLYVTIACVIMVGLAIVAGVSRTRTKDPS